ncbi:MULTISPECIES: hypothetical protein [Bacillus]|uniref:hypothetical protein n=1 Tax=Bacillus TaxID=1386 RepID=UPI001C23A0F4|nr:hypothetical protein [Bacillus paralicheniformis]MBU8582745.1 hypothetical protein [Bacillus paralicheniformis]MCY8037415.1 hypothetical protein [Bacillus paralicheniformis]MCY8151346.1 hypothetical protein [Bacillus paralicheniformis]MCY8180664.1 hypothetical protein [Bacillus paralicheniformis]MCY9422857.1 hypothetical protein [Bacillus paralicheniformis]
MLSVLLPNLLILSAIILFLYYMIVLVKENKINRKQNEETQQLLREILKEVKSKGLERK